MENYTTAIPDSVTESVLSSAGLQSTDPQVATVIQIGIHCSHCFQHIVQVTRMVSLVAQKFLSDVAYEALQHCKMRGGGKEMKKVTRPFLALNYFTDWCNMSVYRPIL